MKLKISIMQLSIYTITDLCLLYIGVSSVFPMVSGYLGNIDTALCLIMNVILLLISLFHAKKCFSNSLDIIILIVFLFFSIALPYMIGAKVYANRYVGILFLIVAPYIFRLYEIGGKKTKLKKIALIICAFAGVTYMLTVSGLLINPYLSRSIKSTGDATVALKRMGIGGYEFVYFVMMLGVGFFYVFWQKKKVLGLIGTGLAFVIAVLSNYMTALFLLAIGCLICLMSGRDIKQRIITILIIVVVLLLSNYIIRYFAEIIQGLSPDGRIGRFLSNSKDGLFASLFEEFFGDRVPTLLQSLEVIKETHGIGLLFEGQIDLSRIGQHSFVFDSLAIFGIPMGLLYFYLVYKGIKVPICCTITFVLLTLINNVTNSLAIAIYFVIPFLTSVGTSNKYNLEMLYE